VPRIRLHDVLAERGPTLIERTLRELAEGRAVETPQDESLATLAPKLSRESARLDFTQDATKLANRIRGLFPWPGCRVRLVAADGAEIAQLTLVRAQAMPQDPDRPAGTIGPDGRVACGRGALRIIEVVPQGRRLMTLDDFRNARPWLAGMRLESIT
jgi:methionyl-tRNA formyltransferase